MNIAISELIEGDWWIKRLSKSETIEILMLLKGEGFNTTRESRSWDVKDVSNGNCASFYVYCSTGSDILYTYPMSSWCDDYIVPSHLYTYSEMISNEDDLDIEENTIGAMDKIFSAITSDKLKKVARQYGIKYNSSVSNIDLCCMVVAEAFDKADIKQTKTDNVECESSDLILYTLSINGMEDIFVAKKDSDKQACLDLCLKYNMCTFYHYGDNKKQRKLITFSEINVDKKEISKIEHKHAISLGLLVEENEFITCGISGIISDTESHFCDYEDETGINMWINKEYDRGEKDNTDEEIIEFVKYLKEVSEIPLTMEEYKLICKYSDY